ncbi:MAG: hypothetical protein WCY25_10865 [Moheibacter sp.]
MRKFVRIVKTLKPSRTVAQKIKSNNIYVNHVVKGFWTTTPNNACHERINSKIIHFTKEGLGIRSTARVLEISPTTLLKRILSIAENIPHPIISKGKAYEMRIH